jgi:hypothetical protein
MTLPMRMKIHFFFAVAGSMIEDELGRGGRFLAVFMALCNRGYFDSDHKTGGFGKRATRKVIFTISLLRQSAYQTHHGAVKLSFCGAADF